MKYIVALLLLAIVAQAAKNKISDVPHGCEGIICPSECGDVPYNIKHPFECTKFCKCTTGQAISVDCPDGLHFNVDLEMCDFPQNANCSSDPYPNGCSAVTSCPPTNGEFAVHLPNPEDCGSFCKCDWGNPIYFKCPDGLHFNPTLQVCDWPQYARCNSTDFEPYPTSSTETSITTTDGSGGNGQCKDVQCPAENGEFALHLPNPNDCGSFCKCDWGQAIYFKCPEDLHFNPTLQVCDLPEYARCNISEPYPSSTEAPINSTTLIPITTTTENAITTTTGSSGGNGQCKDVQCPAENGEFALHLPNPGDCGSFCKCDWGQAIYFKCPAGLHFNPILQVCDWPQNANCTEETVTTTVPAQTTTVPAATTTTSLYTGCEFVRCPAQNGNETVILPNMFDCGSYCICDNGVGIYTKCPDGQHFNAVLKTCQHPLLARCTDIKPTQISPAETTEAPQVITGCELVKCPDENGEYALHLPNPIDCSSFCKCDWGKGVHFSCPAGLHFNPTLQVCDWPQNAGCIGINPGPITVTTKAPSTNDDLQTTVTTKIPTTNSAPMPTGCEEVSCPEKNGEYALHLPHPFECGSFCKCDWGKSFYFKCPAGLHFNKIKQVCDWPKDAGCINVVPLLRRRYI